jgi:hypothetical protein
LYICRKYENIVKLKNLIMKSFNFKNIDRIFAIGGMHGNYKEIFDSLKGFLIVKPEDATPTHPKELERAVRRNKGMYSNNLIQASVIADIVSGLDGRRSTNVTAYIIPHIISNMMPMPPKNRRSKNLNKIVVLNIVSLGLLMEIIPCSFDNCKIKMKVQ